MLVFALTACGTGSNPTVAKVGDISISLNELDEAAKSELQEVELKTYQIRKGVLNDLINKKLLEMAAKKAGKTVDAYLAEEVDAKVKMPTEEELLSLYNSRKQPNMPAFEEMKSNIQQYVVENQKSQLLRAHIQSLKDTTQVSSNLETPRVKIDVGNSPSLGPKDAPITIVEWSDYQCPYCQQVRPTIWKLLDEYKDKIHYVFKDFPLYMHKDAPKAHEACHCADEQGKYFECNKILFNNRANLKVDNLKEYAKRLELDTENFNTCLDSGKYAKQVQDEQQEGIKAGVNGTPAFFINGIMLSGAQPYQNFKQIIEEELNKGK